MDFLRGGDEGDDKRFSEWRQVRSFAGSHAGIASGGRRPRQHLRRSQGRGAFGVFGTWGGQDMQRKMLEMLEMLGV